jgi:hypothetical protein
MVLSIAKDMINKNFSGTHSSLTSQLDVLGVILHRCVTVTQKFVFVNYFSSNFYR